MKKNYLLPTSSVVRIQQQRIICTSQSGAISGLSSNAELNYGGGNSVSARVREQSSYNVWDDDWQNN